MKVLLPLLLSVLLVGCIGGGSREPPRVLAPIEPGAVAASASRSERQLVVALPVAAAMLDSRRVVARPQSDQLSYLKGVAWPDAAPRLLQDSVVQTLRRSGALRAVERAGFGMPGDLILNLSLLRFEADYSAGGAALGRVVLDAVLIERETGRALATTRIEREQSATGRDAAAAAQALLQALAASSSAVADWINAGLPALPPTLGERSD